MTNKLTAQEAIELLTNATYNDEWQGNEDLTTAQLMAIDALKKDIPLPPERDSEPRYGMGYEYYDYGCPNCHWFLVFEPERYRKHGIERCKHCGQLINWSEEEKYNRPTHKISATESNSSQKTEWVLKLDKGEIKWQQQINTEEEVNAIT